MELKDKIFRSLWTGLDLAFSLTSSKLLSKWLHLREPQVSSVKQIVLLQTGNWED